MTPFLTLTLYAPLSSWGDIAVGESRGSWDRPSRSAVLGLVGAALGIRREEQVRHDALDDGYGIGVRLDAPGAPLVDYHTAQTVAANDVKKARPSTRAQLLAAGKRETILSRRVYRQDAAATVALWTRRPDAPWSLDELAVALRRPRFVLYAGRKANVFGLPLAPVVGSYATLADALVAHAASRGMPDDARPTARAAIDELWRRLRPHGAHAAWGHGVAHDACEGFASGLMEGHREVRRDAAPQRARWQFAERVVHVGTLSDSADMPHGTGDR